MWVLYALGSAFFAGVTSILAKIGVKDVDSHVATAIRTIIVLIFSWIMVFIIGSQSTIVNIDGKTFLFLILSGLSTGGGWLFYYKALQVGDVNKVSPLSKASLVLTIILSFIFLGEDVTPQKFTGLILIALGTYFMVDYKKESNRNRDGNSSCLYFCTQILEDEYGW